MVRKINFFYFFRLSKEIVTDKKKYKINKKAKRKLNYFEITIFK